MKTFFILCLPRSRSAWLANLLTYGNTFCFHEPAVGLYNFKEMRALFESTGRPIVGSSDCGNVWIIDGLRAEFPDSQLVVVRQEIELCRQSMAEMGLPDNGTLEKAADMLDYVVSGYSPLVIEAKDLGSPETIKTLCDYVGAEFDQPRLSLLESLNVQTKPEFLYSRMTTENVNSMVSLMGSS